MDLEKIRTAAAVSGCLLLAGMLPATGQQTAQNQPSAAVQHTINITVIDRNHRPISGLKAENFKVYDGDQQQQAVSVNHSRSATCLGLVIDNSGSMRRQHNAVSAAMLNLAADGNPEGETFVVNFNDSAYLDQDFTNNLSQIRFGLNHGIPRGGTALYDAVIASTDHIASRAQCEKRALVLVTDGEDNTSDKNLEQTMEALQEANGPVLYGISMPSDQPGKARKGKKTLEKLASATGGTVFSCDTLKQLDSIVIRLSDQIRNQYSVSYLPTDPLHDKSFRKLKVEVDSPEHKDLEVRAKAGYYARSTPKPVVAAAGAAVPRSAVTSFPGVLPDPNKPIALNCITGSVVDDHQVPVSGITVRALPDDRDIPRRSSIARSDMSGNFTIANLQPGPYELSTVSLRDGYPPTSMLLYGAGRTLRVTVPSNGCAEATISAGPKAARLKVNAVDAQSRLQLTRFIVVLRRADTPGADFSIAADSSRGVLLPPMTELTVEIRAPGYRSSDPVPLMSTASDNFQEITVELQPATPPR